jgi:transcriptional regulator with XRE-family HTH domain
MSERKQKEVWILEVGKLLRKKRLALGKEFKSRDFFVEDRSGNLFDFNDWISSRYLASVELGNNQISLEKLIQLAYALETDPVELFEEILIIYLRFKNNKAR